MSVEQHLPARIILNIVSWWLNWRHSCRSRYFTSVWQFNYPLFLFASAPRFWLCERCVLAVVRVSFGLHGLFHRKSLGKYALTMWNLQPTVLGPVLESMVRFKKRKNLNPYVSAALIFWHFDVFIRSVTVGCLNFFFSSSAVGKIEWIDFDGNIGYCITRVTH